MKNTKLTKRASQLSQVLALIGGAVLGVAAEKVFETHVLTSELLTLSLIFICLVLVSYMVKQSVDYSDEIRKNVGIKILYLDKDNVGREKLFSSAREIVERAQKDIVILNSFMFETSEDAIDPNDPKNEVERKKREIRERDRYYEALIEKATEGITYERILQFREGETVADLAKDDGYKKHFLRVFEAKKKEPDLKISLIKTRAKRFTTFVLVDDENLIWQINELTPSGNMQMQGVFIIHDPRREITQHFRIFIDKANRETLGAVQEKELTV